MDRTLKCSGCGHNFEATDPQRWSHNKGKNVYCGEVCLNANKSKTMANTNRKHASARMVANNPMAHPESLKKMKGTLKRLGHKPAVRGGNGTGLSPAEQVLATATGLFPYTVPTHTKRGTGYPTHYKLDLADSARMLAIEVDGNSHSLLLRQAQDRKKENFLKYLGWTVLRFTNQQVLEETSACVERIKKGA